MYPPVFVYKLRKFSSLPPFLVGQVAARRTLTTWSLPKAAAMPMAWAPGTCRRSELGRIKSSHGLGGHVVMNDGAGSRPLLNGGLYSPGN